MPLVLGVLGVIAGLGLAGCKNGDPAATAPTGGATATAVATTKASAAATGGGGGTAAAKKMPAPCSLISAGEAGSSLGYAVTSLDSSADNDPDQISCTYLKDKLPIMVVLIRSWSLDQFNTDAAKEPGPPKPLSGVGTKAYIGANDQGPVALTWEKGVAVLVSGVSPITAPQVTFLAKVAVGQLDTP